MKKTIFTAFLAIATQVTFAQATQPDTQKNQAPAQNNATNPITDLKQNGNTMDYSNRKQMEMRSEEVPANISSTFTKKYPDQKDMTWYQGESGYTVNYMKNNVNQQVLYDRNGNMVFTGVEIQRNMLPESTTAYLKKNYAGMKYDQVYKITPISGDMYYQVYVNGRWVKFDSKGNYVPMK